MQKTSRHRGLVQGVSLHAYTFTTAWEDKGHATDFGEKEWISVMNNTLVITSYSIHYTKLYETYFANGWTVHPVVDLE